MVVFRAYTLIVEFSALAGMVLLFSGVVQLCVRKKTGQWKEGGAILLAGAIIVGVVVLWMFLHNRRF